MSLLRSRAYAMCVLAVLPFVASCASSPREDTTTRASDVSAEGGIFVRGALAEAQTAAPESAPAETPAQETSETKPVVPAREERLAVQREYDLTKDVSAYFSDPEFKKRFAESYVAETDVEPKLTIVEREQMQKVYDLIAQEKTAEALVMLDGLRTPTSGAIFDYTAANLYFQNDNLDPAAAAYRLAVEKYPKFLRAWKNLGFIFVRQSEFAKAKDALTRVLELGGADARTYGLLAFSLMSLEDFLAAESAYRMANLLDPKTLDWKMGLTQTFFKQRRWTDTIAMCENLLSTQPDRAELWRIQANAYIGLNDVKRAAENFEIVDKLGYSTVESLNMLGDIYVNQELFDLAVERYVQAMQKSPDARPDRAIRAAKVLAARGALDDVKPLLDRVEELRGDRLEAADKKEVLRLRARIAVASGASEEEARVLEEIVAIDPLDGEALILLGQHRAKSGDPDKAVLYYEQAAAIEAFEADAKIRHAQLLVGQKKFTEALPLLRRAQVLKPRENIQQYLEQIERRAAGK